MGSCWSPSCGMGLGCVSFGTLCILDGMVGVRGWHAAAVPHNASHCNINIALLRGVARMDTYWKHHHLHSRRVEYTHPAGCMDTTGSLFKHMDYSCVSLEPLCQFPF